MSHLLLKFVVHDHLYYQFHLEKIITSIKEFYVQTLKTSSLSLCGVRGDYQWASFGGIFDKSSKYNRGEGSGPMLWRSEA